MAGDIRFLAQNIGVQMIDYFKIGILTACVLGSFAIGWGLRNRDFNDYKREIEHAVKAQEAHVESIKKQQELVNKGIANEYEAKIAALRNYYKSTSVWNNASSSKVPGISAAPSATDVITAYNILAGQCAETTAQTIALQDWIKGQVGIK
jgi:hypothetical protein